MELHKFTQLGLLPLLDPDYKSLLDAYQELLEQYERLEIQVHNMRRENNKLEAEKERLEEIYQAQHKNYAELLSRFQRMEYDSYL